MMRNVGSRVRRQQIEGQMRKRKVGKIILPTVEYREDRTSKNNLLWKSLKME